MVSGGCTRMRAPFEQLKHSAAQSADLLQRVLSFLARQQLPNDSQELDSRFVQIFRSHPERLSKKYPRHGIRVADLISGDTTKFSRMKPRGATGRHSDHKQMPLLWAQFTLRYTKAQ